MDIMPSITQLPFSSPTASLTVSPTSTLTPSPSTSSPLPPCHLFHAISSVDCEPASFYKILGDWLLSGSREWMAKKSDELLEECTRIADSLISANSSSAYEKIERLLGLVDGEPPSESELRLEDLPDEVLAAIFSHGSHVDRRTMRLVCSRWKAIERAYRFKMARSPIFSAKLVVSADSATLTQCDNSNVLSLFPTSSKKSVPQSLERFVSEFYVHSLSLTLESLSESSLSPLHPSDLHVSELSLSVCPQPSSESARPLSDLLSGLAVNARLRRLSLCILQPSPLWSQLLLPLLQQCHWLRVTGMGENPELRGVLQHLLVEGIRPTATITIDNCALEQDDLDYFFSGWQRLETPPSLSLTLSSCSGLLPSTLRPLFPSHGSPLHLQKGNSTLSISITPFK